MSDIFEKYMSRLDENALSAMGFSGQGDSSCDSPSSEKEEITSCECEEGKCTCEKVSTETNEDVFDKYMEMGGPILDIERVKDIMLNDEDIAENLESLIDFLDPDLVIRFFKERHDVEKYFNNTPKDYETLDEVRRNRRMAKEQERSDMIDFIKPLVVQMPSSRPTRWTMK